MIFQLLQKLHVDQLVAPEVAPRRPEGGQQGEVQEDEHYSKFQPGQLELEPDHGEDEVAPVVAVSKVTPKRPPSQGFRRLPPQVVPASVDDISRIPPAPSSGMMEGFWQLVAPDPKYEESSRHGNPGEAISSQQPPIGKVDPVQPNLQTGMDVPDLVKEAASPPPAPLPQDSQHRAQGTSSASMTPSRLSSSDARWATPSQQQQQQQQQLRTPTGDGHRSSNLVAEGVLVSAQKVAESYGSPTAVWDTHSKLFSKYCTRPQLSDNMATRLKKLLTKQPQLLSIRSSKMGVALADGYSPIHAAAMYGNLEAVQVMLAVNADLQKDLRVSCRDVNSQGQTALHVASECGHLPVIEALKVWWQEECGYDPIGPQAPGDLLDRTPLGWAFLRNGNGSKMQQVEKALFSPGDASVCPFSPATDRRNGTPYTGGMRYRSNDTQKTSTRIVDLSYAVAEFPGRRVLMEDAWCAHCPFTVTLDQSSKMYEHEVAFFGVYDGHGDEGKVSRFVSDSLPRLLQETSGESGTTLTECIQEAFVRSCIATDALLYESRTRLPGGSTGVSAVVTPTHIVVANVGDSRAILIQRNARWEELSQDHGPGLPTERARIEAAGLQVVTETYMEDGAEHSIAKVELCNAGGEEASSKLATSRAFGDFEFKANAALDAETQAVVAVPEVVTHERSSNDLVLLLACDGIWDVFTNQEAAEWVWQQVRDDNDFSPGRLHGICESMLNECYARHSSDNLTVVMAHVGMPHEDATANASSEPTAEGTKLDAVFQSQEAS